jgi:hypothetical protein
MPTPGITERIYIHQFDKPNADERIRRAAARAMAS